MRSVVDRLLEFAWVLLLAATFFLIVASSPAVAAWLEHDLVGAARPRLPADYPRAAAIVVLGGEKESTGDVNDAGAADSSMTRLGTGRALLLSQRAPAILLSGGKGEAERMKSRLLARGVPAARILTETRSRDTRENALYSAPILRRLGAHRILLVTSGMHMRRAAGSFRKQGFDVIPAPSPDWSRRASRGDYWQEKERAFKRSGECLHELLGLWVYEALGWA
jgi:uncharacterized SAM-binding protein YcdF (DUF218 family)